MSESCTLPAFSREQAARIARERFGIDGPLRPLAGERDLNFLIEDPRGQFVFKIANARESIAFLHCQHRVLRWLAEAEALPRVATALRSFSGHSIERVTGANGEAHACRVLPFIDGIPLAEVGEPPASLYADLGACLARVDRALDGIDYPALVRPLLWKMDDAPGVLARFAPLLADDELRALVGRVEAGFAERVLDRAAHLRRNVIHNDANRGNVLVDSGANRVVSLIDFGDMVESWLAVEPAVAMTYAMLGHDDPLPAAEALLGGYHEVLPLDADEITALPDLIGMRLAMSLSICAHQKRLEPDNEYLAIDEADCRTLLETLAAIEYDEFHARLRAACGLK